MLRTPLTVIPVLVIAGAPDVSRKTLKANQRDGVDAHSLAVDPRFVDPAKGDFRLKADSPALKLGCVPIDISRIGLCKERAE